MCFSSSKPKTKTDLNPDMMYCRQGGQLVHKAAKILSASVAKAVSSGEFLSVFEVLV